MESRVHAAISFASSAPRLFFFSSFAIQFGTVYLANLCSNDGTEVTDDIEDQQVAVKLLRTESSDADAVRMTERRSE